jgi:hypothetical protein
MTVAETAVKRLYRVTYRYRDGNSSCSILAQDQHKLIFAYTAEDALTQVRTILTTMYVTSDLWSIRTVEPWEGVPDRCCGVPLTADGHCRLSGERILKS